MKEALKFLAYILAAFFAVGTIDYTTARQLECADRGQSYSFWQDACK